MIQDFSEDEIVYGDAWGLIHSGVLEDKKLEQMKNLRDKVYGKKGIAITTLKPVGRIEIDGMIYEARLNEGYLDVHTPIKAIGIDLGYVVVNELKSEEI